MHAHTSEVSFCAHVSAKDTVKLYKDNGYDGIVITNHYSRYFIDIMHDSSFEQLMDFYMNGFKLAQEEGDKIGLSVFLGLELCFDCSLPTDFLVYGLDEEFLRSHKFLNQMDLDSFLNILPDDALIYQAHPFRNNIHIIPPNKLFGIEAHNGNPRHDSRNIAFNIVLLFGFSTLFILEIHNLINKLNETNDRLNYIATHDALTGLYNRHSLTGALSALKTSERPFCIVMGDLDDFKKVNDTYGHECGDVVLKSVSEVILRNMDGGNTACRWGGEEILMIMYGSAMDCFHTISRIKAQINDLKITHDGTPVKVSMTFGFAASGESGSQDIDAMLSTVDKRLYKGKASGKNVIVVE